MALMATISTAKASARRCASTSRAFSCVRLGCSCAGESRSTGLDCSESPAGDSGASLSDVGEVALPLRCWPMKGQPFPATLRDRGEAERKPKREKNFQGLESCSAKRAYEKLISRWGEERLTKSMVSLLSKRSQTRSSRRTDLASTIAVIIYIA